MKKLNRQQYDDLVRDAVLLTRDTHGDKVLVTPDQHIIKLFRTKRRLSSARLVPYALRFMRNSQRLRTMGFVAPDVREVYYCPDIQRHLVTYPMLIGKTLREEMKYRFDPELVGTFARFIAALHDAGIYFRSLHMGNLLHTGGEELSLIDVADMTFRSGSLGILKRLRNFRQLCRYHEDLEILRKYGTRRFLEDYLDAGETGIASRAVFRWLVFWQCPGLKETV